MNKLKSIFVNKIELEYQKFVQNDMVQWINLMLNTEVFQSYASIVTPNESTDLKNKESKNYQMFLKRYLKVFLKSQAYVNTVKKQPPSELRTEINNQKLSLFENIGMNSSNNPFTKTL